MENDDAVAAEHGPTRETLDKAATDPGVLQFVIERSKKAGNDAFKSGNYKEAAKMYTQAIAGCETDASLFSNRSAAYLALGRLEEALWDAQNCVLLSNMTWAKGFYRLGNAHMAMGKCALAADAFRKGAELAPDSEEMVQRLSQAEEQVKHEQRQAKAQIDLTVKTAIERLKKIRQDRQRQKLLNQFKSAMVAPEYDIEDFEWRPTFLPAMKLHKSRITGVAGAEGPTASVSSSQSSVAAIIANYVAALADLDGPKRALGILNDNVRLEAYDAGIRNALEEQPGGHILVAGGGTGILALMSSAAPGVGAVTAVERSKSMYAMAKLAIKSNRSVPGVERIRLLDCAITACRVHGETQVFETRGQSGAGGSREANEGAAASAVMPSRADILVTDAIDESVLGQGLMQTLDYAGEHLLAPGARVVPARIRIFGAVAEVGRIGRVRGLDLSPINVYRWYPHHEPIDLHKVPVRLLTKPKELHMVDLQERVDSAAGKAACSGNLPSVDYAPTWDVDDVIELDVCQGGVANGVVWWFEADMRPSPRDPSSSIVTWSGAAAAGEEEMEAAASAEAELPSTSSWNQAWQYIDDVEMEHGAKVRIRVQQDKGQVHFTLADAPTKRVRHNLVPRWHFDMLLDDQRNGAYEAAITSAVNEALGKQDGPHHENKKVAVLDMGSGTGILGMMAARAGATQVVGVEQNGHMADIGEECMVRNGFFGKCIMMDGDVRRLTRGSASQADGTAPDLDEAVDIVVAEVFDAGLIGEGALHMFAAAQNSLVADSYQLVPAAATVYFQLVQMRTGDVRGFDMSQLNRYRWRPDYEGLDLATEKQSWTPLSAVHEAFHFDFKNWQGNLQSAEMPCRIQATNGGICNAVAFWFDLDLGAAGAVLSSSPYSSARPLEEGKTGGAAPTWPQAVQWIEEKRVCNGMDMVVTAKHDTYGITFEVISDSISLGNCGGGEEASDTACGGPLPPLYDQAWNEQYQRMEAFNRQMMKACAQNPLEYRKVAEAAVAVGSRPLDFGLESWKAAEFCAKIMS